ncbi:MAG TPA: HDIG domain-containing protein [Candidatus Marinimicrobia bacterium]|nr:HDIG domain-containing protein [Candidatus Neomarinimicrobiota bacterium]
MVFFKIKKRRYDWSWARPVLIILLFLLLLTALIPREALRLYDYKLGEIARQTIIAPYDFDIMKSEAEIRQEEKSALEKTVAAFNHNQDILNQQSRKVEQFFQMARSLQQRHIQMNITGKEREMMRYTPEKFQPLQISFRSDSIAFWQIVEQLNTQFGINVAMLPFVELYNPSDSRQLDLIQLEKGLINILINLYNSGIVDIKKSDIPSLKIGAVDTGEEVILNKSGVLEREEAVTSLAQDLIARYPESPHSKKQMLANIARLFIEPNLIYDKERTEKRQDDATSRIPIVQGRVLKDEKIVDANIRITDEVLKKLNSLNFAESQRHRQAFGVRAFQRIFSDFLILAILYSVQIIFLFLYKREVLNNLRQLGLLIMIQILVSGVAFLLVEVWNFPLVAVPIPLAALMIVIFFDVQIAVMSTIALIFVLAHVFGTHFQFILLHILPAYAGILFLRQMRNREQIFTTMLYILLAYFVTVSSLQLVVFTSWKDFLNLFYFALLNSVVSILGTYGLVGLLEKIFDVTTDITLLELSDLNRPILRDLAIKAPGTFHHSVMVGTMVEAAAEAIGANSLLARVGAYYHDIGKISKAEYFIENQQGENKLNQLKPYMAAKVVVNHVREGLELADIYKLPQIVKDFIDTHHGTSTVAYFLDLAKKEAANPADVNEDDFRYHGRKPFTKETGLLMIIEAMEAAVRSLKKPSYQNVEQMVDKLIKTRVLAGELDETPLTMADLAKVKVAVIKDLSRMHHARIEYPEDDKNAGETLNEKK